ncbi:sperm flagellar protein 1 [Takifugu flavidus]|uniref:sperm flagellar protein 1 n=1 Tax=Takifugu flavidus TaxID=433684 RepID=UPI002543FE40|nr:sperm flagellar protein 1 [Takifugu flavidus]
MDQELTEEELQDLYAWLDKIPLSRPKRHITRDFSDGVLAAEVVKHFLPKLVDLHNYTPANSTQQKLTNWDVLNRKVFSKLSLHVPEKTVRKIVLNTAGAIEPALHVLKEKLQKKLEHDGDHTTGLDYYDTRELEKHADITHTEERFLAQLRGGETKNSNLQRAQFYAGVDPTLRQILQEKEETVLALQQTVEILQMKVNRLEHLVHLKDMRIQDLTQHLETYKTKGKA